MFKRTLQYGLRRHWIGRIFRSLRKMKLSGGGARRPATLFRKPLAHALGAPDASSIGPALPAPVAGSPETTGVVVS